MPPLYTYIRSLLHCASPQTQEVPARSAPSGGWRRWRTSSRAARTKGVVVGAGYTSCHLYIQGRTGLTGRLYSPHEPCTRGKQHCYKGKSYYPTSADIWFYKYMDLRSICIVETCRNISNSILGVTSKFAAACRCLPLLPLSGVAAFCRQFK